MRDDGTFHQLAPTFTPSFVGSSLSISRRPLLRSHCNFYYYTTPFLGQNDPSIPLHGVSLTDTLGGERGVEPSMGKKDCFWTILRLKKRKEGRSNKVTSKETNFNHEHSNSLANGHSSSSDPCVPQTVVAAIQIQTAFRAFMARKAFKHLKGAVKFQVLIEDQAAKNQALNTLSYIHSWSKIQAEIRARRLCMVTEGRLKQKKLENQLKVDAMLHELEVEWCGGSDTMEEILLRIQQREAAAVKRERALAYAFSHQWRANSSQYLGQTYYEVGGKESWGWSWTERWIAARPWEIRVQSIPVKPMKVLTKTPIRAGKVTNNLPTKTTVKKANPTSAMGRGEQMPDPSAEQERATDLTPQQPA